MELLTISGAAKYVNLCRASIYKLIERGEISVVRLLAASPRIKRSDLDALVEAKTVAASGPGGDGPSGPGQAAGGAQGALDGPLRPEAAPRP